MECSDSVADWVMVAVTAVGFVLAFVQLRSNLKDSRIARTQARAEENKNREAMARAVSVKASWKPRRNGRPPWGKRGRIPVEVEVLNSGAYPIMSAVLELTTDDDERPMQVVYGTIPPGKPLQDMYLVTRAEVVFGELTGGAALIFTDTYGNHWRSSTSWDGLQSLDGPARIC